MRFPPPVFVKERAAELWVIAVWMSRMDPVSMRRVPLLLNWRTEGIALAELAGLPLLSNLEGTSLKPLLDDPARSWKMAAFSQFSRNSNRTGAADLMGYSMRTDRYRLTVWVDRADHTKIEAVELYDHETDPQENTNIAADPKNKALVQDLMQ